MKDYTRGGKGNYGLIRLTNEFHKEEKMKAPVIWERESEWAWTYIQEAPTGWIVEHTSSVQGETSGSRILVPYSDDFPRGMNLSSPWNEIFDHGDMIVERAKAYEAGSEYVEADKGCRTLRRGHTVQ